MKLTNSQLKNYLLGKSGEQAEEEIGLQIIADEEVEEKLLIAENELMEDFLDKNLSPEEEKLFYENFLIFEDRQKHLEEISFFRQYSKKHLQSENLIEETENQTKSFSEKIKNLFGFDLRFAAPVLAILIIAAMVGFYFLFQADRLSPLEKEFAELNRQDFANTNEFSEFTNVSLISGTFRNSGSMSKIKTENLTDKIFFRLGFPFDTPEKELLDAEIIKDQKTIFRQTEISIYKNQNGREIRLLLPKAIFEKGRYQIKIENPQIKTSPVIYDFVVE